MAGVTDIAQVRRIVFRSKESKEAAWSVFELGQDDLGQDTIATINTAPRKKERTTQAGTTSQPIPGTYDNFSASITFAPQTWRVIGEALRIWNPATFANATPEDGNIIGAAGTALCATQTPVSVIVQGVCDNGSTADLELARCYPSMDDDLEIGTSNSPEVTLQLNPQIYNPKMHAEDGYEPYDYREGAHSLTTNERLNVTTGAYEAVGSETTD